jgi:hypothetical protein
MILLGLDAGININRHIEYPHANGRDDEPKHATNGCL